MAKLDYEKFNRRIRTLEEKIPPKIHPKKGIRADAPHCIQCGAYMLLKTSYFGQFYGCSQYPRCKGKIAA